MITALLSFFSNLFKGTGQVASAVESRDAKLNTPEMQANAAALERERLRAEATRAVSAQDQEAIRRKLAE